MTKKLLVCLFVFLVLGMNGAVAQKDGLLTRGTQRVFPIGFYYMPPDEAGVRAMSDAGINLIRCHSRADLDRVHGVGMMGCMTVGVVGGATPALRAVIEDVKDHPALVAWEGPDELVWNFTTAKALESVGISGRDWWAQRPHAVEYAKRQAAEKMPKLKAGIALIRELDERDRPFWMNEARLSDEGYVKQYLPHIDITGCDYYPVRKISRNVGVIGECTDRWVRIGQGKPVWMVLQAFSWSALDWDGDPNVACYPRFAESRFMAYDAVVHGAKGILYWGAQYCDSDAFYQSLLAVTSELDTLQPFLVEPDMPGIACDIRADLGHGEKGVRVMARRCGDDVLVVLANEDRRDYPKVRVSGLGDFKGRQLDILYSEGSVRVKRGRFDIPMGPYEVRVLATGREWETARRAGRDYEG